MEEDLNKTFTVFFNKLCSDVEFDINSYTDYFHDNVQMFSDGESITGKEEVINIMKEGPKVKVKLKKLMAQRSDENVVCFHHS